MNKNPSYSTIFCAVVFAMSLTTSIHAYAQYPAASALLSNAIEHYSINSKDDYLQVEQKINTLSATLQDAHQKYPALTYTPIYSGNELSGFIISGVHDNSVADELSSALMQLDVLGKAVTKMDMSYLPSIRENKLSRVSRKEASR
jgi:hypothetical protein